MPFPPRRVHAVPPITRAMAVAATTRNSVRPTRDMDAPFCHPSLGNLGLLRRTSERQMRNDLSARPVRSILRAIADAAERWSDGDFPPRVRALERVCARTGYSMPVAEYAMDRLFEA